MEGAKKVLFRNIERHLRKDTGCSIAASSPNITRKKACSMKWAEIALPSLHIASIHRYFSIHDNALIEPHVFLPLDVCCKI